MEHQIPSPYFMTISISAFCFLCIGIGAYLLVLASKGRVKDLPHLVILGILAAAPAKAITLSTLRADCRSLVKDSGATRNRFSDAQLLRFLNEGQKDLVQYAKPIRVAYSFELVSGTTFYAMPSDFLTVIRLTRSYQVLQEMSIQALDKQIQWQTVGGLPLNYYVNHSNRTNIGFYPFPNTTNSTGTIRMEYSAQATDMASDSDQPFNSIVELQPYGYYIALWCGYRASMIDQQNATAQAYYAEYRRGSDMLAADAFSRPNYRPGAVGGSGAAAP